MIFLSQTLQQNTEEEDEDLSSGPDYHYLYDMQIRTLTKEKREKLLKERDDKVSKALHNIYRN